MLMSLIMCSSKHMLMSSSPNYVDFWLRSKIAS